MPLYSPSKFHICQRYQRGRVKVSFDKETHLSGTKRPTKESKTMNTSFMKIFAKTPKVWQQGWMASETKCIPFFNNCKHHGRHTQVHKQKQGTK